MIVFPPVHSLVLASGSRARQGLLRDAGVSFQTIVSHVPEPDLAQFDDLESGLGLLAQLKARGVARQGVTGLILAADTVTRVGGELLGKPADRADACRMLGLLSGSTHDVLTGWCLLRTRDGVCVGSVETTQIVMRPWTTDELEAYLASGEWEGRCGAYGLESPDPFVTEIRGSESNVVGLPLERIAAVLREFATPGQHQPES